MERNQEQQKSPSQNNQQKSSNPFVMPENQQQLHKSFQNVNVHSIYDDSTYQPQ